mgnify:CR=1 FL=1
MPKPGPSHPWSNWHRTAAVAKPPPGSDEAPQIDVTELTPRQTAARAAANLERIWASRPLKPPPRKPT